MLYDLGIVLYFLGVLLGLFLIFRKAGVAPWKALIPIYNIVVWIKVCGKDWKWYIYFLIPAINVFTFLLLVVETAKVFRRYGFWEQTFAVIFPWVYLPILGLSNKMAYTDPAELPKHKVSEWRDWLDAIVFALVAAVIIRGNIFELYHIPSSSMEKTLLVGDRTLVSKYSYGARVTMTPLAVPLVHNVMPFTGGQMESFVDWIKLPYHRYTGLGNVERYDAVVFNYPDGDTMCSAQMSNRSYYDLVRQYGREAVWNDRVYDAYGQRIPIGHIRVRPIDKRENFIKRCIGLPGEELSIVNQQIHIDGKALKDPANLQFTYSILFQPGTANPHKVLSDMGVSEEDYQNALMIQYYQHNPDYQIPLTRATAEKLKRHFGVLDVQPLVFPQGEDGRDLFPHDTLYSWSIDNYGPIYIPKAGDTLHLDSSNISIYQRLIATYENNTFEAKSDGYYINGVHTNEYVVKQNYYWMMGDNRHNSADSRYWGFVPEDHILGKFTAILWSFDKDTHKLRWNRIFKSIKSFD